MTDSMVCAQRGAQLLDRYYGGPEWAERINLKKLDISCPTWCVIGQLNNGRFAEGATSLMHFANTHVDPLGFNIHNYGFSGGGQVTAAWRELIEQRKGGNGPAVHNDDKPVRRWKVFPFPHYEHNRRAASRELVDAVHGG